MRIKNLVYVIVTGLILLSCNTAEKSIKIKNIEEICLNKIDSGSSIQLKKGTYKLSSPISIIRKSNISIDGNGATLIMQNMADDVLFIDNSNNIKLINFKATHIEPEGPVGCTGNVIHIENGSGITIEDCDLNGSGIVGIAAYGTKDLRIINNYIHENSQYGIIYQGPQIEIKGNRFQDNGNGNIYFSYQSITWPPNRLINSNQNSKGLTMSSNTFIE